MNFRTPLLAYAKWESGATIPDIEKSSLLAKIYGVTGDSPIKEERVDETVIIPPTPAGKSIWVTVTVSDRGQIEIPEDARDKFGIMGETRLIVGADENGIALIPVEIFEAGLKKAHIDAKQTE